jgi:tight adherence protein B
LDRKRVRVRRRLEELDRMSGSGVAAAEASILRDETLSSVPRLDRFLQQFSLAHRLRIMLTQADVSMRVGAFMGLSLVLAVLAGLIAAAAAGLGWVGILGAIMVGSIPTFVIYRKKEQRRRMFERQFPDALDLMTGALRSGMAFTAALQVVAEESPDPVAAEFRIVFEEHRLGLSLRESLEEMTKRVDSTELRLFVTAVLIQKDTGGNLAEILDGAAYVIRDRFRILGDVRTITAQARFSGMVLMILPLVLAAALLIIVPDYLRTLITDPVGPYFIGVAVFLQVVGFFAIRKIVNIKV